MYSPAKLSLFLLLTQALGVITLASVVAGHPLGSGATPHLSRAVEAHGRPKAPPRATSSKETTAHEPMKGAEGHGAAEREPLDAPSAMHALFEGNGRFVSGQLVRHHFAAERRGLVAGQHPKAIVLSCSDSRLPPELIFDQTLGDLFVVRSAGNVLDRIELASMEYAAEHLHTRLLVVLGHERCGAVTAAVEGGPALTPNLQALMEELGPSIEGLRGKFTGELLVHQAVEANVEATADKLLDRSPLLSRLVKEGKLAVVEAVYDLETGRVRQLAGPERALAHLH